jgi:hypothetical protein
MVERGRTPFSGISILSSIARNFNKKHIPISRKGGGCSRYAAYSTSVLLMIPQNPARHTRALRVLTLQLAPRTNPIFPYRKFDKGGVLRIAL